MKELKEFLLKLASDFALVILWLVLGIGAFVLLLFYT